MNQLKELPILFKGEMVNAILLGWKKQTRRVMKPQPKKTPEGYSQPGHWWPSKNHQHMLHIEEEMQKWAGLAGDASPFGDIGDRLWVKETFFAWGRWETRFSEKKGRDEWHFVDMTKESGKEYLYAADGVENSDLPKDRSELRPRYWKRPSIFMPRSASRILLEITDVRVERLQDITTDDANAEGIQAWIESQNKGEIYNHNGQLQAYPVTAFSRLWQSINGPDSWNENPWVWVVEFKRVETGQ